MELDSFEIVAVCYRFPELNSLVDVPNIRALNDLDAPGYDDKSSATIRQPTPDDGMSLCHLLLKIGVKGFGHEESRKTSYDIRWDFCNEQDTSYVLWNITTLLRHSALPASIRKLSLPVNNGIRYPSTCVSFSYSYKAKMSQDV